MYGQLVAVITTLSVMGFGERMRLGGGHYVADAPPDESRSSRDRDLRAEIAEADEGARRDGYDLLVPLLYAPLVPLLRIGLRGRVAAGTLHRLVGGVVACALGHAGYIMLGDSTMGLS